jgi:Multiubiquitin
MSLSPQVHAGGPSGLRFEVGDEQFQFRRLESDHAHINAAKIAEADGKHPADEYVVLRQLASRELQSMRPDETVELHEDGSSRFFVIKGDRTYRFEVDKLEFEWPRESLEGGRIKELEGRGEDFELLLEREGEAARVIADDELVHFGPEGIERMRTRERPRLVTVYYGGDDEPFELERREYKTEELLLKFSVPAGYVLDLVEEDGTFRELEPGKSLKIKEGMHFVSHLPVGKSS